MTCQIQAGKFVNNQHFFQFAREDLLIYDEFKHLASSSTLPLYQENDKIILCHQIDRNLRSKIFDGMLAHHFDKITGAVFHGTFTHNLEKDRPILTCRLINILLIFNIACAIIPFPSNRAVNPC